MDRLQTGESRRDRSESFACRDHSQVHLAEQVFLHRLMPRILAEISVLARVINQVE